MREWRRKTHAQTRTGAGLPEKSFLRSQRLETLLEETPTTGQDGQMDKRSIRGGILHLSSAIGGIAKTTWLRRFSFGVVDAFQKEEPAICSPYGSTMAEK